MRCIVHFVVHSFKDFARERLPEFFPGECIHLDLSKVPLNEQFNECSIVDSDEMWGCLS